MSKFDFTKTIARMFKRSAKIIEPKPELTPSEFAEQYIEIPEGNARPGPINFDNAPYQKEPLDMCARDDVYMISLMWGAQTGKTSLFTMAMSYFIYIGRSMIMAQPSEGDLKTWLATKFETMVETCKMVASLIAKPRSHEGVNNQKMKSFLGGFLMFAWSGSAKTARGRSAPVIITDEEDGYERTEEGDFGQLLWNRANTFGDQRIWIRSSTPTRKDSSTIDTAFHRGDQRHWHVECPHCGKMQVMDQKGVKWEVDEDGDVIPESVGYLCDECGVLWDDVDRITATRRGKWIPKKKFSGHVSYHLPSFPSTMVKLVDIARNYVDCEKNDDMQTYDNTVKAVVSEDTEDTIKAVDLAGRDEAYAHDVPKDVLFLTMGVDVQHDRIELEVVGWGMYYESWSIDYRVIWGDTGVPEGGEDSPWDELTEYIKTPYRDFMGEEMRYKGIAIDSGDGTRKNVILAYTKKHKGRKVHAIKGVGGWDRKQLIDKESTVKFGEGDTKKVTKHCLVSTDLIKYEIRKDLLKKTPGKAGFCHFPAGRPEDYYQGIAESETLTFYYAAGKKRRRWDENQKIRNEPLDLRVYAYAMAWKYSPIWSHEKAQQDKRFAAYLELLTSGESEDLQTARKRARKARVAKMLK